MFYAEDCSLTDCSIFQNGVTYYAHGGIVLYSSYGTRILNNLIYNNNGSGIDLLSSTFSHIYNNLITNNSQRGISLSTNSENNVIYGNAIGWNGEGNARDDGNHNSWDDEISLGNWWSDYNITDSEVYEIDGRANSQDNYPQEYRTWKLDLPIQSGDIGMELYLIAGVIVAAIVVFILVILKRRQIV